MSTCQYILNNNLVATGMPELADFLFQGNLERLLPGENAPALIAAATAFAKNTAAINRDIIREDRYGKLIAFDDGEYQISVDDTKDAGYIGLWHNGKKVGFLTLTRRTHALQGYKNIGTVEIEKKHQGKGYGLKLYQTALRFIGNQYKGIASEREQRSNNTSVPAIYKKLGGIEKSGSFTVNRNSKNMIKQAIPEIKEQASYVLNVNEDAIEKAFDNAGFGYYVANSLRYFFYEKANLPENIDKIDLVKLAKNEIQENIDYFESHPRNASTFGKRYGMKGEEFMSALKDAKSKIKEEHLKKKENDFSESSSVLFSKTTPKPIGSTVSQVKSWLPKQVTALMNAGKLKVVQSVSNLPEFLRGKAEFLASIAWHGSRSDFDYFSHNYIGEGEGAAGWGYGTYLTKTKAGAVEYKRKLQRERGEGKVYKVEIPDVKLMLDLDKYGDEQSAYVKKALRKIDPSYFRLRTTKERDEMLDRYNGRTIYQELVNNARGWDSWQQEANASKTLLDAGIKGNTHTGFGDRDYVVFDEDDLRIIAKYSLDKLAGTEALYDPKTDTIYLVADMLTERNTNIVLSHELVHRAEAIDPLIQRALTRLESSIKTAFDNAAKGVGSSNDLAAYQRVIEAQTAKKDQLSEFIAYKVTEFLSNPANTENTIANAIKRWISAIKVFLLRNGLDMGFIRSLNESDFVAMSRYGARVEKPYTQYEADDILAKASKSGYEGNDKGEAFEWLRAVAKGLDMSKEARMARAKKMGFDVDTVWYHGTKTKSEIKYFNLTSTREEGNRSGREGTISFTSSPEFANEYAGARTLDDIDKQFYIKRNLPLPITESSHVIPVYLGGKIFDFRDKAEAKKAGDYLEQYYKDIGQLPSKRDMDYLKQTILDGDWGTLEHNLISANFYKNMGYDGFLAIEKDTLNQIMLNPNKIRSIFAEFDPDFADSPNLLASTTGQIGTFSAGSNDIRFSRSFTEINGIIDSGHLTEEKNDWQATKDAITIAMVDSTLPLRRWAEKTFKDDPIISTAIWRQYDLSPSRSQAYLNDMNKRFKNKLSESIRALNKKHPKVDNNSLQFELGIYASAQYALSENQTWLNYTPAELQSMVDKLEAKYGKSELETALKPLYAMNQQRLRDDVANGKLSQAKATKLQANPLYVPLLLDAGLSDSFNELEATASFIGFIPFKDSLKDAYDYAVGVEGTNDNDLIKEKYGISLSKKGSYTVTDELAKAAMDTMNVEKTPTAFKYIKKFTSLQSRMVTLFMMGFAPTNMIRDVLERTENLRSRTIAGESRYTSLNMDKISNTAIMNALANLKDIYSVMMPVLAENTPLEKLKLLGFEPLKLDTTNARVMAKAKQLREFLKRGASSTYGDMLNFEHEALADDLRKRAKLPHKIMEGVLLWNNAFELISGFSVYQALTENNQVEPDDAAETTLNLMNFHKGGRITSPLRSIYMFFNPIVQGGTQLYSTITTKKGFIRFAVMTAIAAALYSMLRGADDDDDELGFNRMDRSGNFKLYRNIRIPLSLFGGEKGEYFDIPLGFGSQQLSYALGVNITRMREGDMTAKEFFLEGATIGIKAVAPISPAETNIAKNPAVWFTQTLTPQILKPIVNVGLNVNAFGGNLTNDKYMKLDTPKSEQGMRNTPPEYKDAAKWLFETAGIDMYPEQIRELIKGYGAGIPNDLMKIFIDNPAKVERGLKTADWYTDRWLAVTNDSTLKQTFYYELREKTEEAQKLRFNNPDLDGYDLEMAKLGDILKKKENHVKGKYAAATKAEKKGQETRAEAIRKIADREKSAYEDFAIKRFREISE